MQQGIVVYRASRLEALLPPLLGLMDAAPPQDALAPYSVIAAHPGIRQWLSRAVARARGAGGVAANLDIQLPSAWLDQLAQAVLGETAVALKPYRREALRWRLYELLPEVDDAQVRHYLEGLDVPRRRFQLADRLAAIYARYIAYRPDWLAAWAAGQDKIPQPSFLAPLWRRLRQQIGQPHRGERLNALMLQLDKVSEGTLPHEPLHVFGVSHLAPSEFATLCAVARQRPVVLYVPDPCREYWAGLKPERHYLRELVQHGAFSAESEQQFFELGHPLLADWGRQGQHFMLELANADGVAVDIRHGEDEETVLPPQAPRLARLQESIRQLSPALLAASDDARADRSLRVHACHTRLRELEVLRDALLRAREENPALKPSDIVVMAPDIQAYVPLLAAVFGEAGRQQGLLPYHLADVPVVKAHPLLAAFATLLELPQTRLSAPQVLDLLGVPEIAVALGLDGSGVRLLENWIARSRIAWALDAQFRADVGVPAIDEHTFAWGMDRLLAGYVLGAGDEEEASSLVLPDGSVVVPVEGVHGVQAEVLGALDRLLQMLALIYRDAQRSRSLSAWSRRFEAIVDTLFRAAYGDHDAAAALDELRRLLRSLAGEAADAQVDADIDFSVVREVLRERLLALSERQRFLMGGMTVCGMVPQRAIPFRVVAVLGLNDGEFPRAGADAGLDLMALHRRLGDRDVRSDDRYLFLETVMAAREQLHLSFIGEGVRDGKPRNPGATLAELMAVLDQAAATGEGEPLRPWLVRHPLQPFDARYFDGSDAALFSYRADLIGLLGEGGTPPPPFLGAAAAVAPAAIGSVSLASLLAYFRRPAEQILVHQLGLRLDALEDDRLAESEPLQPQFQRLDRIAPRLFHDSIAAAHFHLSPQPPDWLRHGGLWPPGRAGERAWKMQHAQVDELLAAAAQAELFRAGTPRRLAQAVDLVLDGVRVQGELTRLYRSGRCDWLFDLLPQKKEAELDFGVRVPLFLEWALHLLQQWPQPRPLQLLLLLGSETAPWQAGLNAFAQRIAAAVEHGDAAALQPLEAALRRRVGGLVELYVTAQQQPSWYFPRTSWAAVGEAADERIVSVWQGGERHTGERDYAPGYARLLAEGHVLEPGSDALHSLKATAQQIWALIDLASGHD